MAELQEFFDQLAQASPEKRAGINASYLFDIEGAGKWHADVKDEGVTVTQPSDEQAADVTLSANDETFKKIVAGEQNATSAYMTGKLKIRGDMGAAMKLQKLFA